MGKKEEISAAITPALSDLGFYLEDITITSAGRRSMITVIVDGDTAQTYGDACSVNGTSISGGIKWPSGLIPASTNNYDILTFVIVRDAGGTVNVFGSINPGFA